MVTIIATLLLFMVTNELSGHESETLSSCVTTEDTLPHFKSSHEDNPQRIDGGFCLDKALKRQETTNGRCGSGFGTHCQDADCCSKEGSVLNASLEE